jgi:hypothetical protein
VREGFSVRFGRDEVNDIFEVPPRFLDGTSKSST